MKSFKEHNDIEEALVTDNSATIDAILNDVKRVLMKDLDKGDYKRVNQLAKIVNKKVAPSSKHKGRSITK